MTIETLKALIEIEYSRCETYDEFKKELDRLLDLYEKDNENLKVFPYQVIPTDEPDMVPYGELCSCNPKNGGDGICGCIMGNQMVPNPKKYPGSINTQTTTDTRIQGFYFGTDPAIFDIKPGDIIGTSYTK